MDCVVSFDDTQGCSVSCDLERFELAICEICNGTWDDIGDPTTNVLASAYDADTLNFLVKKDHP